MNENSDHQRVTCTYGGEEYLLPRPGAILCSQRLGNYTYLGMSNGDVYVSQDDGETWRLRHTFGSHEITSISGET